jgi:hypothetical protein
VTRTCDRLIFCIAHSRHSTQSDYSETIRVDLSMSLVIEALSEQMRP